MIIRIHRAAHAALYLEMHITKAEITAMQIAVSVAFIDNPELVTVAERDKALLIFKEEMQKHLNGLSEEEIAGGLPF